jgi:hypothetical protein
MNQMKNKKIIASTLLAFIILCITCIVGIQAWFYGCFLWNCAPSRSFSVYDLDIPDSYYPDNASIHSIKPPSELAGAIEAGHKTVYWDDLRGLAVYHVDRFGSESRASENFLRDQKYIQNRYGKNVLEITDVDANEYFAICGYSQTYDYRCWFLARYEEYVIMYNATVYNTLPEETFIETILFIDKQIGNYLYPDK